MNEVLHKIAVAVERGKIDAACPYPPDMQGQDGADELTRAALDGGIGPNEILQGALVIGMRNVGERFGRNEVFIPDVLMAAKAMNAAMKHIKPYFRSGEVQRKGTLIIGTVHCDLHDIGKNIVGMIVEGGGWEVLDQGVDTPLQKFVDAVDAHPGCVVGLSTLLTTTMQNMADIVGQIKEKHPDTKIIVGGAPINKKYADGIGADAYSPDPQGAVEYLNSIAG
jgi:methanogenic corrinoid protein MtbC1